jgi:hypothetical protein
MVEVDAIQRYRAHRRVQDSRLELAKHFILTLRKQGMQAPESSPATPV